MANSRIIQDLVSEIVTDIGALYKASEAVSYVVGFARPSGNPNAI